MEKVLSSDNMHRAWKQVKANKGAAGVDGMSTKEFPEFARTHWNNIRNHLTEGSYKPSPVKRVEIPKPESKLMEGLNRPLKGFRRGGRYHLFYPISYLMSWIKSLKSVGTGMCGTQMTSSS